MMANEQAWSGRLEITAFVAITIALLGAGVTAPAYDVAVAGFTLYQAYARSARVNLAGMWIVFVAIIADACWLGLYGQDYSNAGGKWAFGLACICISLIVKIIQFPIMVILFMDYGGLAGASMYPGPVEAGAVPHHTYPNLKFDQEKEVPVGQRPMDQSMQPMQPLGLVRDPNMGMMGAAQPVDRINRPQAAA